MIISRFLWKAYDSALEAFPPFFSVITSLKLFFFLTKEANVKSWQCCLKRRPSEADRFHVIPLASAWGSTVYFQTDYTNTANVRCLSNIAFLSEKNEYCTDTNDRIVKTLNQADTGA